MAVPKGDVNVPIEDGLEKMNDGKECSLYHDISVLIICEDSVVASQMVFEISVRGTVATKKPNPRKISCFLMTKCILAYSDQG